MTSEPRQLVHSSRGSLRRGAVPWEQGRGLRWQGSARGRWTPCQDRRGPGEGLLRWCCQAALSQHCMALFSTKALNSLWSPRFVSRSGIPLANTAFSCGPWQSEEDRKPLAVPSLLHPARSLNCRPVSNSMHSIARLTQSERRELRSGHAVLKRTNH